MNKNEAVVQIVIVICVTILLSGLWRRKKIQ